MQDVFIVSINRTPIGSWGGGLSSLSATELGAAAIKGALANIELDPARVEEVFMGNVVSANVGQAPARQAALYADIPNNVPCTTINKVCASGMKSAMFAAQAIQLGMLDVAVAGGMESMSNIPYYLPKARFGYKFGNAELVDGLVRDGLQDVYDQNMMGVCADATADKYTISREAQDAFAIESYSRATKATESGAFAKEMTPVEIQTRKGKVVVAEDEEFKKVNFDKIPTLRPAFSKTGTVTAANASTINDGAAALVLMSEKMVKELHLQPLARIVSMADAAQEPQWFTTAPVKAAELALKRGGLNKKAIDLYEVNEAFSVVTMAFNQSMGLDAAAVNIFGGAVSLGHPLGCSGARILVTLSNALQHTKGKLGCAAICNGGGGASSMIIENLA